MDVTSEIRAIFDEKLNLGGAAADWTDDTALLGALPELDSLAVTCVMLALEDRFAIMFAEDELEVDAFSSVGALRKLIEKKLGAPAQYA
jgi:acyl carrier protein